MVAHPPLLGRNGSDGDARVPHWRHDGLEVPAVELDHRDDAVVELHAEGGHRHRLHVASDLLRALLGAGDDVQLLGPADLVGDDAGSVHRGQPAELLLDVPELCVVHEAEPYPRRQCPAHEQVRRSATPGARVSTQCQWSIHSPVGPRPNEAAGLFPYRVTSATIDTAKGRFNNEPGTRGAEFWARVPKADYAAPCPLRTLTTESRGSR